MKRHAALAAALLLLAIPPQTWAGTVVEEASDSTAVGAQMDLLPQGPWDTFGEVSNTDPIDYGTQITPEGKKVWVVIFWVDPLNGSWVGRDGEPVGQPPYNVYVGGLPQGSCKLDKRMGMPKAYPVLIGPDGKASPDNTAWAITFDWFGEIRFILTITSADGRNAPGNIVMTSRAYRGGDKCGYAQNFNKNWTVTLPNYDE